MSKFRCPVCKKTLSKNNNSLQCENNHCFDISKQGYVNLLQSQKSNAKRHGDDRMMVVARQEFLNKGYYNVLLEKLTEIVSANIDRNAHLLDAGCGECFYTSYISSNLTSKGFDVTITGIDISKDALIAGLKRCKTLNLAVASIYDIPVCDNDCDMILNIFAPISYEEYRRLLKHNGILIRVIPLERHLWGLKCAIYDAPYENKIDDFIIDGFDLIDNVVIKQIIDINCNEDIQNLFKMTPYYYKTGQHDQQKVANLNNLKTELELSIIVYKKA